MWCMDKTAWLDTGHGYSVPVIVIKEHPLTVMSVVTKQSVPIEDADRLSERKESNVQVEDLLDLSESTESNLLYALQERFRKRRIYTSLGDQLIFVNSQEKFPIYDEKVMNHFSASNKDKTHIFATVRTALQKVTEGSTSETIVFRGESGSGKTFNALQAMRYLATAAPSKKRQLTANHMEALHTVFSSFSSAKTPKNDESTRFGYIAEFLFKSNRLEGLSIRHTLPLELSRVVGQRQGERNYNVFYELCAGLEGEARNELGLKDENKFFYMHPGRQTNMSEDKDGENFKKLENALDLLGFTEDQRMFIYKVLASVLHMGNIYYRQRKLPDDSDAVDIGNEKEVQWISHLLETSFNKLFSQFTSKFVKTENGLSTHPMNIGQALDCRDSVAQLLYEELFLWILSRISQYFKCPDHTSVINIVDMYGFERYAANGLQQLSINTANEKMQQLYVQQTFKEPITEYLAENVTCNYQLPSYVDNDRVVDLLLKKPTGLLPLLDDECKFPKASDDTYLQHANLNHLDKSVYGKARNKERCEFSVRHFSGTTWYSIHEYIRSNRRAVPAGIIHALAASQNTVLSQIFRNLGSGKESGEYIVYTGLQMSLALQHVLEKLNGTNFHFVHCLRANNERAIAKFDLPAISRQLKALAVVETHHIRTVGYPMKLTFQEFSRNFRCLLPGVIAAHQNRMEIINDVLIGQGTAFQNDFIVGQNYVFLREKLARRLLSRKENTVESSVLILQKSLRGAISRKEYLIKRKAVMKIQAAFRGWKARKLCIEELDNRKRTIAQEARRNKRLMAYHQLTNENPEETPSVSMAPVDYIDVGESVRRTLESPFGGRKTETKSIHHYLPIQPQLHNPTVHPMSIEQFAHENFKGHLLEIRREPIVTPFLAKDEEIDFQQSINMFKLVLKYMNDTALSSERLQLLVKIIVQMAIGSHPLRDELFVQICNQTYRNRNKANCERGWTLMLSSLNSFPPSIKVLPMLLSYFAQQPASLRALLNEALLRKIKTVDQTATRQYAPHRLEQVSFSNLQTVVVQIETSDGNTSLVEAHPWATAEEVALRSLRERGIANSDGWSITIENNDRVYAPSGGQFIHDAICEMEGAQKERSLFFNYAPKRVVLGGREAQRPESRADSRLNRVRSSPVEKRRDRSAPAHVRDISERSRDDRRELRNRDVYGDVSEEQEDYSSTMPKNARSRHQSGDVLRSPRSNTISRIDTRRNRNDNKSAEQFSDDEMDLPIRAPSQNTMKRHHNFQRDFAEGRMMDGNQYAYIPQGGMQYVPMVPVMMTPQGMSMVQPMYGGTPSRMSRANEGKLPMSPLLTNEPPLAEDLEDALRMPRDSRLGVASRNGCDRVPSEYSTMSVASRIRRIPVPRENADVDRFLDEVFEQVLTPHEYTQKDATPNRIASTIKGGYGTTAPQQKGLNRTADYNSDQYAYVERRPEQNDNYYDVHNSSSNYYEMQDPPRDYEHSTHSSDPHNEQVYGTTSRGRQRHLSSRQNDQNEGTSTTRRSRHHSQPVRNIYDSVGYQMNQPMFMMMPMPINSGAQSNDRSNSRMGSSGVPMQSMMQPMMQPMMMAPQMMFCMPPGQESNYQTGPQYRNEHVYDDYDSDSPIGDDPSPIPISPRRPETLNREQQMRARLGRAESPSDNATLSSPTGQVPPVTPRTQKKLGLNRIPPELYRDPVVQNQVSNSEHPNPHRFPLTGIQFAKEHIQKEKDALFLIQQRQKHLPPPIDHVFLSRLKAAPLKKEEPEEVEEEEIPEEPPAPMTPLKIITTPEYVPEVDVERSAPRLRDGMTNSSVSSPVPRPPSVSVPIIPIAPFNPPAPSPVRQRPALTYAKQPWKLTIRKEMFLPNEPLDDAQVINQVFAQIIEDCKRAIPYRIRPYERERMKELLKASRVPPELLSRQSEIPTPIKVKVIEAVRQWPLYFCQMHEVIEERASENVFLLLALSESGIRLLVHTPETEESPLKIQDHFEFNVIRDVMVEGAEHMTLRTMSGMKIVLRTPQAHYIRATIEKCLHGDVKEKQFMRAVADYITKEPNLLSFVKGDIIEVLPREGDNPQGAGWVYGKIGNRYGNLPAEYVQPIDSKTGEPTAPAAANSPLPLPIDDIEINDYNFDDGYEGDNNGEKHTMMEFALMYFRGPKGEMKRRKEWTWKDVADKVKWTDRPIGHSLLRLDSSEADKVAVDAFSCIMRYMDDESLKKNESLTDCVYKLLLICKKHEPMRDEVYCQIIRQTTNNKSMKQDSTLRGWRLFSILTAYFTCSQIMSPYLAKYLSETASDPRRAYHGTAQLCMHNLIKTRKYGGRKFLLSGQEIEEISRGNIMKRQQYILPGGHKKVVNTRAVTVVEEVIQELCNELNILSPAEQQEFSLCYAVDNENSLVFAANDEYILDICTELEHQNKKFVFLLRRTVWVHPLRLDNQMYIDVVFFQLLNDYLDGMFCSHTSSGKLSASCMDDVAKMGALLYCSSEQREQVINAKNIFSLVPRSVVDRNVTGEQWAIRVKNKLAFLNRSISPTQARADFLEVLERWPLFGATLFAVVRGNRDEPREECLLAIHRNGIQLLQRRTHIIIEQWPFTQVLSSKANENSGRSSIELKLGSVANHRAITLETEKSADIARLLGQYIFVDSNNKGFVGTNEY